MDTGAPESLSNYIYGVSYLWCRIKLLSYHESFIAETEVFMCTLFITDTYVYNVNPGRNWYGRESLKHSCVLLSGSQSFK
jgi:hypothetical protein